MAKNSPFEQFLSKPKNADLPRGKVACFKCSAAARVIDFHTVYLGNGNLVYKVYYWCDEGCHTTGHRMVEDIPDTWRRDYVVRNGSGFNTKDA